MNAPASTSHYRHAPTIRADREMVLTEATDRDGKRYFFGFIGTQKYFMTQDRFRPDRWTLYSQSLRPGPDADTAAEPETGPHGGRLVRQLPEPQPGFVSALPPRFEPRGDGGP